MPTRAASGVLGLLLVALVLAASACGGSHATTNLDVRIQSEVGRFAEDKRLTMERDILKEATAFFARESS